MAGPILSRSVFFLPSAPEFLRSAPEFPTSSQGWSGRTCGIVPCRNPSGGTSRFQRCSDGEEKPDVWRRTIGRLPCGVRSPLYSLTNADRSNSLRSGRGMSATRVSHHWTVGCSNPCLVRHTSGTQIHWELSQSEIADWPTVSRLRAALGSAYGNVRNEEWN